MQFSKKIFNPLKLVVLCVLFVSVTATNAQSYQYDNAWGEAGLTLKKEDVSGVKFNFSIDEFHLSEQEIDGETMMEIKVPHAFLPNNEGAPNVPGFSRYIAVPQGATPILNVTGYRLETIQNVSLAPSPRIPFDNEDGPMVYKRDNKIYTTDALYPATPFQISELTQLRGVDAVMLGVTPFQYNPVTRELLVYRDVEIELTFEGGNGHFGTDRYRSRWFDPILQDAFANYKSLPEIDYSTRIKESSSREGEYEYLIVIPNDPIWQPYAEQIKEWRTLQGILTGIVTLAEIGGNTPTILENYFNDIYANWATPPVAVLLMADFGTNASNSITSPIWDGYCASDNIFADVNNNDMPDIIFARMTAQNATHLQVMVSKMLDYEAAPPTNANFYKKPITALGWQTERWFQICSETVGGYWREVTNKQPVRINAIYSGTPGSIWSSNQNTSMVVNYFGPNGTGYIPATPAELGGWSGGTASQVISAINDGAFALQHRDHGFENGWGEPDFQSSHINSLNNTEDNELVFVFSINCLTGKYNMSSECFTEKFHRHTSGGANAGALGLIAASEISYSFVNDAYVWGMFDNFYPDFLPDYGAPVDERGFLPAFGNAAGKYFLQQSNWPYNTNNKEVTYHLFHHHGGAFLQVYSEVPQTLAVTHNPILYSGESAFTVVAEAGAYIALTVNGQIIGTALSTGGANNIVIAPQLPPNTMIVTITKQNYFRYESTVEIIPPDGAYVVGDSYEINDAAGNNNGLLDYGEAVLLDMTMKNVGVDQANNVSVTMSTQDTYVTITDATETFGNIGPDATVSKSDAFAFEVTEDIPDGHMITMLLESTDGTDVWESYISIQAHAPELKFNGYSINDSNGNNNGFLDPGETVILTLTAGNAGSADAYNVVAGLSGNDTYVTVLTLEPQIIGDLTPGNAGTASYSVTALASTPFGHTALLDVSLSAEMGINTEDVLAIAFADYCEASTSNNDEYIQQVICGEINNISGWQGQVADYTDMTTTLVPGVEVPITIENGNAWSADKVTVWIDWNLNKELGDDATETFVLANNGSGQTFTGNIVAPANQASGQYRMRIRMTYSSNPAPCGNSSYGEVEDYTILIGQAIAYEPPQNVEATVTGSNVTLTWEEPLPMTDDVLGYNVYMDNQMVAAMVTAMTYTYNNCPDGSHWFSTSAAYPEGESGVATPCHVEIGNLDGTLQGVIRDASTNLGIADAWVTALNGDFGAVTYSTPFGSHYSLHLAAGTYDVSCEAAGYQPIVAYNVPFIDGDTKTINFYMYPVDFDGETPDFVTGMFDLETENLSVYPNPAMDEVNISASGMINKVKILNNMGQLVFNQIVNQAELKINTRNFLKGIYYLEIQTDKGISTEKLIIE